MEATETVDCPTGCLLDLSESIEEVRLENEEESVLPTNKPDLTEIMNGINEDKEKVINLSDKSNNNNCILDPDNLPMVEDTWLDKETFDFDLVLSPTDTKKEKTCDEEEEIFFGPVGFTERCVAAVVAGQTPVKPMSPLNPKQLAEMIKEAQGVACLFSSMKTGSSPDECISPQKIIINTRLFAKSPKHNRNKTFCKDADTENIEPKEGTLVRRETFTKEDVKHLILSSNKQPLKESNINGTTSCKPESKLKGPTDNKRTLKPPNSRLPKSRSASNLPKAVSSESLNVSNESLRQRYKSGDSEVSNCSITSDSSEPPPTTFIRQSITRRSLNSKLKAPSTTGKKMPAPTIKPSLTNISRNNGSKLTLKNLSKQQGPSKTNHKRTTSNSSMESLSSQSSAFSNSSFKSSSSNIGKPVIKSTKPKTKGSLLGPLSKLGQLKLIKPSFQKKVPSNDTRRSLNGPIKAVNMPKPSGFQNKSFTERQPKNVEDVTPVDGTPVKLEKSVKPKRLSSTMGTLGKSSSVGSTGSCGSVTENMPTSSTRKRHSLLPTPSKSRPCSSGSIPQSPMSCRSSNSSVNSWLGVSLSDAADSPVFETDRNKKGPVKASVRDSPSIMKSKKKLVQNTPDIPLKKPSRWSPIVRRKVDPDDQALQCTKRIFRK